MKTVLFPGSFDPFTNAHLEIVERLVKLDYKIAIGIFANSAKQNILNQEDRVQIIKEVVENHNIKNVEVFATDNLLALECADRNIDLVVRGIRSIKDYEYEKEMEFNNKMLNPELEYIYLTASVENNYVSSTIVRELYQRNVDFSHLVPVEVAEFLKK